MASIMETSNTLRKALFTGSGLSFGAWQMLPGSHLSRAMARCGFDWICIDCEHGNITDNEMHDSVHAVASVGVSPIVRIPANEGWMVKRALDAGAHGIIVPLLYTVQDAKRLVESAKFPPRGKRGFGSPFSMGAFDNQGNLSAFEYMNTANDNLLTIAQIETKEAFECVEEIARVDGVDVLFIGLFDLSNNLGYSLQGGFPPEMTEAVARILKAAKDAGKKAGIYCPSGEPARQYADQGFHMISAATDATALPTIMTESLSKAKGQTTVQAVKGAAYGGANVK
ncbi:hypothetical protein AYO20_02062 [Fonsecaea nubica]|uniref:HpcH/HpaI aldolase/citrate lyase domain-containing protein n=1 Tax=Fonsecaea nubica TaxID=856822 RepID=A0A178DAT1_9EURO|nr:hypothetical protein AYO20_02062 [Fonsecaea nubica]OAL38856.1 hypothetical protein AYO20_02062 [Fonsecaea nubica]